MVLHELLHDHVVHGIARGLQHPGIFASTYSKTKSLALVTIEHGLYGISLFLIGLGWYFYGGAVH